MKKILCIGHASYDYTIPLDYFPQENTKNRVPKKLEGGGGPACNAAYLLGKWKEASYFMGVVGNDQEGKIIISELKSQNVNIDFLEVLDGKETTKSTILVNTTKGTRTTLTYRDNTMKLSCSDINFVPDVILVDGQELEASKKVLKAFPKAISIIDAGTLKKETLELGKMVDYLVCSKDFAEAFVKTKIDVTNEISMRKIASILETEFNNVVVVTLEEHGCMYKHNKKFKVLPSIKVKALDTTGAGDIFHGAFAYGVTKGWDLEKTLKVSTTAAALSVTKIGSKASVFSLEKVMEKYEKHDW